MPIPDHPTAWHTSHNLNIITTHKDTQNILIQIKEQTTTYPINEIDQLIQALKQIKEQT